MENIILQTHGISVKYGNFLALDDVALVSKISIYTALSVRTAQLAQKAE